MGEENASSYKGHRTVKNCQFHEWLILTYFPCINREILTIHSFVINIVNALRNEVQYKKVKADNYGFIHI